jgi:hypothetical protein
MAGANMAGAAERPQAQEAFDVGSWAAIRQSAAMLSRDRDGFVRQLHHDITSLVPELGDAQAPDMWAFCERMAQSLLWVALTDQPLGVVADALRRVGAQNWADGFPDTQYPTIAHALVQTVHYLSGTDWSPSTGSVWIGYFMWIKPHLLAGAQQAIAEYTAAQQEAERRAAANRAFAEREAAQVEPLAWEPHGQHTKVVSDVNIEHVVGLLDEDEGGNAGYSQPTVSMTRNQRRAPGRHTS